MHCFHEIPNTMRTFLRITLFILLLTALILADDSKAADGERASLPVAIKATDWPWWRGPSQDGIASSDQQPPLKWSKDENIAWKTPIPGRGHGCATVVGNNVFIATADLDAQEQSILCLDRATGKVNWKTVVHTGGLIVEGNKKASLASSTPACDGQHIYINFLNNRAVHTTALSLDGKKVWQTKITDYTVHQGYGSSPTVYKSLVLVSADNKAGGAFAGLDRETGAIKWKRDRPKFPNYASPIVHHIAGKDQLIFMGCDLLTSLSPLTGEVIWEHKGATTECVSSIVTDGKHVFTSGGYPKNHIAAVIADGSGKITWENTTRVYVPSMIVKGEYLYAVTDGGVAMCWKAATGEEQWKGRLGGDFSGSPVLVGNHFYAMSEQGTGYIFKASPTEFELIAKNKLGDEVYATPTIVGGKIYLRIAEYVNGKRQESVVCVGK